MAGIVRCHVNGGLDLEVLIAAWYIQRCCSCVRSWLYQRELVVLRVIQQRWQHGVSQKHAARQQIRVCLERRQLTLDDVVAVVVGCPSCDR